MNRKAILALTSLFITSAVPLVASAQQSPPSGSLKETISKTKDACKDDLNKYCAPITPGQGRLAACLQSREDQLSPDCANAWISAKNQISRQLDKTEIAFRKSCSNDVQKFCSNVPSGQGRILNCIDQHMTELSPSCRSFTSSIENRLGRAFG